MTSGYASTRWKKTWPSSELVASGARSGASVRFTKAYERGPARFAPVAYDGVLNAEATEIDGTWTIKGRMSGRFLMIRSKRPEPAVRAEKDVSVPVE